MFHQFGYEWIKEPVAGDIRAQLQEPNEVIFSPRLMRVPDGFAASERSLELHVVQEPKEHVGFLVILPKENHRQYRVGVWLPLFGAEYLPPGNGVTSSKVHTFIRVANLHPLLSDPKWSGLGQRLISECFPERE
jgi:hypothetical protein